MILIQHYLACLSRASYLIGDETTGRAVVVDPRRDVGVYLQEAGERCLRIERVIETHVHADFVSGHLELASRAGAVISYGAGADAGFPIEPLHDGQRLSLPPGEIAVRGVAWSGAAPIALVEVSLNEAPWQQARLIGDRHRHRWQWWELQTRLARPGRNSIRARATDFAGRTQPGQPQWNRHGYGNNAIQRVQVQATP